MNISKKFIVYVLCLSLFAVGAFMLTGCRRSDGRSDCQEVNNNYNDCGANGGKENGGGSGSGGESGTEPEPEPIDAKAPNITTQPVAQAVFVGEVVNLSVAAVIADEGELQFQWINVNESGVILSNVTGAINATFSPNTEFNTVGVRHFRVRVTNMNNMATGNKQAYVMSDVVSVNVHHFVRGIGIAVGTSQAAFNEFRNNPSVPRLQSSIPNFHGITGIIGANGLSVIGAMSFGSTTGMTFVTARRVHEANLGIPRNRYTLMFKFIYVPGAGQRVIVAENILDFHNMQNVTITRGVNQPIGTASGFSIRIRTS